MADDLTKMDRWNSEPLDVHTWSDHPEIKTLCDDLYDLAGMTILVYPVSAFETARQFCITRVFGSS